MVAVNGTAAQAGIFPGVALAEARALLPILAVNQAAPAADAKALATLARWCGRYTPWTAVESESADPGYPQGGDLGGGAGLWLDVSGCAHLFGGERALLHDLTDRLGGFGITAVAAVADTPGAAWAAARFRFAETADLDEASDRDLERAAAVVVPSGGACAALAPLPVSALRLPSRVAEDLARVGLRRVADVEAVPRGPLTARFGDVLLKRLDQALGRADEPLSPRRPLPAMIVRLAFAEPIGHADDVSRAADHLIADLCVRLEAAHRGARRLELSLYRSDGTVAGAGIGTSRPVRDPAHLRRLFRKKLETMDAGFGVEVATLAAVVVEPLSPTQMALRAGDGSPTSWTGTPTLETDPGAESIARLIDRLGNRLGPGNVSRFVWRASHSPERACREAPCHEVPAADSLARSPASSPLGIPPLGASSDAAGTPREPAEMAPGPGQQSRQPRPLTLLPWPEPIEVIAPVPDGPPVMICRGIGRGRHHHKVIAAEGPERIGPEWWLEEGGHDPERQSRIRDYYRIEDERGCRFWIYREGLYRPGIPPRWYLHGLFA